MTKTGGEDDDSTNASFQDSITDVAGIILLQGDLCERLEKMFKNFKKLGAKTTIFHCEDRLRTAKDYQNQFNENHSVVVRSSLDRKDPYFEKDYFNTFDESFMESVCFITEKFNSLRGTTSTDSTARIETDTRQLRLDDYSLRLPQLDLPKFSGKYVDWPEFHDQFLRLVHSNSHMLNIEKFRRLKNSLPDNFDSDISSLSLTDNNYTTAWNLLSQRYDNKRVLFTSHMNSLISFPRLERESAQGLREIKQLVSSCVNGLKNVGMNSESAFSLIVFLFNSKLPQSTHQHWEQSLGSSTDIPKMSQFLDFLEKRFRILESWEFTSHLNNSSRNSHSETKSSPKIIKSHHTQIQSNSNQSFKSKQWNNPSNKNSNANHSNNPSILKCLHCKGTTHLILKCSSFLNQDTFQRKQIIDRLKLCLNCLSPAHKVNACASRFNCQICGSRHHTLLHFPSSQSKTSTTSNHSAPTNTNSPDTTAQTNHTHVINNTRIDVDPHIDSKISKLIDVLIPTAIVHVKLSDNLLIPLRALVDQASTGAMITQRVVDTLNLKQIKSNSIIKCPDGLTSRGKSITSFTLTSQYDESFEVSILAAISKNVTDKLPSKNIVNFNWPEIQHLQLADPHFTQSRNIDLLLGADVYAQILKTGVLKNEANKLLAQETVFGWIISGSVFENNSQGVNPGFNLNVSCHHTSVDTDELAKQFFESEGIPGQITDTFENDWCEDYFRQTCQRQSNGKYLVRLPFKKDLDASLILGKSRHLALRRFYSLERKLEKNPDLKEQYYKAINEYFTLNQIELCETSEGECVSFDPLLNRPAQTASYLPHHAVLKPSSLTTKCRVVFDASMKTSNGNSLNDIVCKGPPLLNDLTAILLNWRLHRFVFLADMEKMYRCINVDKKDAQFQRILWYDSEGEIRDYFLNTVTFGTAPAPYLAIRVLHQLAEDEKGRYPLAYDIIKKQTYMDDVSAGSDTIENCCQLIDQVKSALSSGGLELRKWSANEPELLKNIPPEHYAQDLTHTFAEDGTIKTLGMTWKPSDDSLQYVLKNQESLNTTKRDVLSQIMKIYDPLGLINPIILKLKIFMKKIHQLKIEWDDCIPSELEVEWKKILTTLPDISNITIPRWFHFEPANFHSAELHVFCDGALSAHAASIYLRIKSLDNQIYTTLISTKSKITPANNEMTIPQIELCAAVLGTKLMLWAVNAISLEISKKYYWTDSSIALCWIRGNPDKPVMVKNRVKFIKENSKIAEWFHVSTENNSADISSRGATPNQLSKSEIYWHGPKFLQFDKEDWPEQPVFSSKDIELLTYHTQINTQEDENDYLKRYSSFQKIVRITAWLLRWKNRVLSGTKNLRTFISVSEIRAAKIRIIKLLQEQYFPSELKVLTRKEHCSNKSILAGLVPFLDEDGLMRTTGRLKNSNLFSFNQKHPIILPSKHEIVTSIIDDAHLDTEHGSFSLTMSHILKNYWIIHASRVVKNRLKKCVQCYRQHPRAMTQLMGNLPYHRVNYARPFSSVGVDFTGPFWLKSSKYRGNTRYKGYIVLYICLVTKAVHLDVTTGLSTEDFLASFQRFIGRRGVCAHIFSDNGPNFTGANKRLDKEFESYQMAIESIMPYLTKREIKWHFIPPYSPNFGGLWESNIKSMKHHLKCVVGDHIFTYEEFNTILIRIESCLNSRPLCPLTSNELEVITPGHFLIGDSLLSPPESSVDDTSPNNRYLLVQRTHQQFWKLWSQSWLLHLQNRNKWKKDQPKLKIDDVVLIKEDNLPPNVWLLGKITELHAGNDKLPRVATIKTMHGVCKRSISKLCKLPIDEGVEEGVEQESWRTETVQREDEDENKVSTH